MILTIDIGNTTTSCGLFDGGHLMKRYCIPTHQDTYARQLKLLASKPSLEGIIICSVVPDAQKLLLDTLRRSRSEKAFVLGKNCAVPIKNRYRYPRQVGQDRLVNAFAAVRLYGAPAIVIDYGTAVTFDVISRSAAYLGGMIVPGIQLGLNALSERTALLPRLRIGTPKEFVGRDTRSSMLSGMVYGIAALTDEMVKRICRTTTGARTNVIATGGNSVLIQRYCTTITLTDPDLTLKGLQLLYTEFISGHPR